MVKTANPGNKIKLTYDEYDKIVETCERMEELYFDEDNFDAKVKFTQRMFYPTIEMLKEHHVEENIEQYLKYLIYYLEVFPCPDEEDEDFQNTKQYIRKLIYDKVDLVD